MNANQVFAISRKYVDETASEFGALKGANATIRSVEPIENGQRITFEWKNSEGETRTTTVDIPNGIQGEPGEKGDTGNTGFPPQITVNTETESTYKLSISYVDDETGELITIVTPNLKGSGSGGDEELTPEQVANLISLL